MAAGPSPDQARHIVFRMLGVEVVISAQDRRIREWISANFGAMLIDGSTGAGAGLSLDIDQSGNKYRVFDIAEPQQSCIEAESPADLLYSLEKVITIGLQKRRSELLFLHAAAVERDRRAYLLAGDTGAGKSTTTWGLLRHGFGYLSDELGAIDLRCMEVLPYPHALCLKRRPAPPYELPAATLDLGRTLHVPAANLGTAVMTDPCPLAAVLLLQYDASAPAPMVRRLTAAEAAARLYVTGLNTLAHPDAGLPAMLEVATGVPCFGVVTAHLSESCRSIASTVDGISARGRGVQ